MTAEESPISIVTAPGSILEARRFLERFSERQALLEGAVERQSLHPVRQIFYFPMNLVGPPFSTGERTRPWYAENDTFFIPETEHRNLDSYAEDALSSLLLFGDTGRGAESARRSRDQDGQEKESIALELRTAYAYLYNRENSASPEYRLEAEGSPQWEHIRGLLDAAYARGDVRKVREVLGIFRQQGLTLPEPPRTAAGERSGAASEPIVTMKQFMQEWHRLMPMDALPDEAGSS